MGQAGGSGVAKAEGQGGTQAKASGGGGADVCTDRPTGHSAPAGCPLTCPGAGVLSGDEEAGKSAWHVFIRKPRA